MTWATSTAGRSRLWGIVALFACFGGFLLLVLAIVLGGWLLAYAYHLQLGEFSAITLEDTASFFAGRLSSSGEFLGWQLVAGLVPALVVAAGVRRGIGLLAWLAVPLLLVLFAVLMDYALDYGDLAAAGGAPLCLADTGFSQRVVSWPRWSTPPSPCRSASGQR